MAGEILLTWMRLEVLSPLKNAVVTSKLSVVHPFLQATAFVSRTPCIATPNGYQPEKIPAEDQFPGITKRLFATSSSSKLPVLVVLIHLNGLLKISHLGALAASAGASF